VARREFAAPFVNHDETTGLQGRTMAFYGVTATALGLFGIRNKLDTVFKKRLGSLPTHEGQRLASVPIAIIFARPDSPAFKADLFPSLEYYHHRSSKLIELFVIGYLPKSYSQGDDISANEWSDLLFDAEKFAESIGEIENETTWRYSGQTDIIVAMAHLNMRKYPNGALMAQSEIDFSQAVCLCVERAVADKLIPSGSAFLENVIRASRQSDVDDVVASLSRGLAIRGGKAGLIKWIAAWMKIDADALKNVCSSIAIDLRR
jgi:hypothetical protein